jgi:hypothetical protein
MGGSVLWRTALFRTLVSYICVTVTALPIRLSAESHGGRHTSATYGARSEAPSESRLGLVRKCIEKLSDSEKKELQKDIDAIQSRYLSGKMSAPFLDEKWKELQQKYENKAEPWELSLHLYNDMKVRLEMAKYALGLRVAAGRQLSDDDRNLLRRLA